MIKGVSVLDNQFIIDWIEKNKDNMNYWIRIENGKLMSIDLSLPEPNEEELKADQLPNGIGKLFSEK